MLQRLTKSEGMTVLGKRLAEFIVSLREFTEGAETDFILLGIELHSVQVNVTELTRQMLETAGRISGESGEGVLASVERSVGESLGEIESCQEEVDTNLKQINALVERLGDLYATSGEIKTFAKFLHAVALNIFIENSRTGESFQIFADIAQEIKELSGAITGIAGGVYDNVEEARAIHVSIHDKISKGMGRLHSLTGDAHEAVRESICEAEQLMSFSVQTIEEAGARSQEISSRVGEIVVGVQFHDNMRQRMEHMMNTLQELADGYVDGSDSMGNGHASSVIRDQAADIREMIAEVDGVFRTTMDAIQGIERETGRLVQGFWGDPATAKGESGLSGSFIEDPFSSLKGALEQLHRLLDQGRGLYGQLQGAASHAAEIATKLSEQLKNVRNISRDTHIKALNSIIAADRLGEKGRTLKVLAQEMKDLAARSDVFVDDVEAIIESIAESAGDIGKREMNKTGWARGEANAVTALDGVIDHVSREYEQFRENYMDAYERTKFLRKSISATSVSLDFFNGLSGKLKAQYEELRGLYGELNPGQDMEEGMRRISGGKLPAEGVKGADGDAWRNGGEYFGDNVELF